MDVIDTISCLLEHVNEEIEECICYAKLAMKYKDIEKPLYGLYSDLASQEYVHYQLIFAQAQRVHKDHIGERTEEDIGERILEWQYNAILEKASKAKIILDMCKS